MNYQRRSPRKSPRKSLARVRSLSPQWIVVICYRDDQDTTDVIGCDTYRQALGLFSLGCEHVKEGGVHCVSLLDADRRVLFDTDGGPRPFEVWAHIPQPGKYRFDADQACLIPSA